MNITGAIRQLIVDNATAAAIVGQRVYPVILPQSAIYPAVKMHIVSSGGNNTKSGVSSEDTIMLQVSSFAFTYNDAQRSDDAIRAAIDYYRGTVLVGAVVHGLDLVEYIGSVDLYEEEPKVFHRASDYKIRYSRNPAVMIPEQLIGGIFESDEAALLAGLEYGQYYHAAGDHVSESKGVLIKLIA